MVRQEMQVDYTQAINELANRLRILESKLGTFGEKMLVMNQNMIEEYKKMLADVKAVREDVVEVKKDVSNVKNVVKHLTEEASKFAKDEDVRVLQKYVDYWNPIKFATIQEVEDMIARAHHRKVHHEAVIAKPVEDNDEVFRLLRSAKESKDGK
tara:strand:- start:532 stop:993 length:462 start_codon:yes stop_codon:yes gene_type:complete